MLRDTRLEAKERFAAIARTYLGTPWKHEGRTRNGIDCVGLVLVAAREAGLTVPEDVTNYARTPTRADLLRRFEEHCVHKDLKNVAVGDILVTRDESVLLPCHCGIVAERHGEFRFIHAYARSRKVIESMLDEYLPLAIRLYEVR